MRKLFMGFLIGALLLGLYSSAYAIEIVRQKNVATYVYFPIVDNDGDVVTSAAGLDSELDAFADGTAPDGFADCTNEATEVGSSGWYYLSLAQGEMNADYVAITVKTSTEDAKAQQILIRTTVGDPLNIATTDDGGTINVTSGKIDEVATLTGHTAQSGDSYAIVNSGTYGNSAIKTLIDAIPTASEIQTEMEENGASILDTISDKLPTNYIMGSSVQTDKDDDIDDILTDTAALDTSSELRTLLAGSDTALSTVTTAQVNAEVVDVVETDNKLNLLLIGSATLSSDVALASVLGQMLDDGTAWSYDRSTDALEAISGLAGGTDWSANEKTEIKAVLGITNTGTPDNTPAAGALYEIQGATFSTATDSLEALRNRGDSAWISATGFSTHSAADVWSVGTRALTDKSGFALSSAGIDSIWDEVITGHATADSFGKVFDDQVDGLRTYGDTNWLTAAGFSTHAAADVWSVGTRTITGLTAAALADMFDTDSGTTYSSAVSGSVVKEIADNAGGAALTVEDIRAEIDNNSTQLIAIVGYIDDLETRLSATRAGYLDKLNVSGTLAHSDTAATYKADVSGLGTSANQTTLEGHLTDIKGGTWNGATDSLEAIRDRGDAAWASGTTIY